MAQWWTDVPAGQVVRLEGADNDAFVLSLQRLPATAPAILTMDSPEADTPGDAVTAILAQIEQVVLSLFPAWLPGADGINATGAGVPAIRAIAKELAATSVHFGPFIADLAEDVLRGDTSRSQRFAREVRAAGLARLLAVSFDRTAVMLLVRVRPGLVPDDVLIAAYEWLSHQASLSIGLIGSSLHTIDRVASVRVRLPADIERLAATALPETSTVSTFAVTGRPHPASSAEQALELALARCPWAWGRSWNQTYQSNPLASPIRIDLLWEMERCAVEIDGPEHRAPLAYAADRQRDVALQLDGFAVLRFTNSQIVNDLETVISHLERFLLLRRRDTSGRTME